MMAYIITPRWARLTQRAFFEARYLLLASVGVIAVIQTELSLDVVGWTLIVGALCALVGVATGRFHFELVPIWFLIAALVWAVGVMFATGRPTSGVLALALVPALGERLLHLMLVASRARLITDDEREQERGTQ